ncbi:transglycosylase SLT domain-containing protein [Nibribacter ruber]|uniref:Transglycosylase SLT domain-containing protein n=1 Tax=Nibribacter ruber TaxID=2698458 RepID=A0A6P1P1I1_9BACT|nr:lytic transglycosylase domain-containing protein [Nibribacter ruber]QHL87693.1 transglycosylase SLT domain-containing protein [Nibribacter ruber]
MRISTFLTGVVLALGLGFTAQAQRLTVPELPIAGLKDSTKLAMDSVEFIPVESNELIQDRLSCLESEIPLEFNKHVRGLIDYFTIRNRKYTRRILEREQLYFPMFEKYLAKHNMPDELKYLAVVESALLPKAVSSAKAVGLWQFMTPTANDFRLVQNSYLDERMDPEKSTEAACKFLKQLHKMFGSWEMALAAYNCGPGNVKKAIARSGGKRTFWEIYPYLPKETRSYVPSFTAIVYAMNHAPDHNIKPDSIRKPVAVDTVLINNGIDLKLLAKQLNLPENQLVELNPALRKPFVPETVQNFALRIPVTARPALDMNRMAILDSARYRAPVQLKLPASSTMVAKAEPAVPVDSATKKTYYTVRRGDNLDKIAKAHDVTISDLKTWNKLKGSTLLASQKLIVAQPAVLKPEAEPKSEAALLASAEVVAAEKDVKVAGPNAENTPKENAATALVAEKKSSVKTSAGDQKEILKRGTVHHVQPGDTLWNISKRYNNVSVDQLKKANNLKDNEIKPGMKLIVG